MEAGITGTQTITVTEDKTAQAMGSGTLPVFATPAMIALMENTAYKSVADELEEGAGTVGTLMNVKHVAATPVGMEVTCETKLVEVDIYSRKYTPSGRKRPNSGHLNAPSGQGYSLISISD